jgi:hypothetical protein
MAARTSPAALAVELKPRPSSKAPRKGWSVQNLARIAFLARCVGDERDELGDVIDGPARRRLRRLANGLDPSARREPYALFLWGADVGSLASCRKYAKEVDPAPGWLPANLDTPLTATLLKLGVHFSREGRA